MAFFRDRNGIEWPIAIVFGELPALKRLGLDLDTISDKTLFALRYGSVLQLVELLWTLTKKDAGTRTREEFDSGLDGESIERACDALTEAILDFSFRRLRALVESQPTASPSADSSNGDGASLASSVSTHAG